jgi:hypothetical protein
MAVQPNATTGFGKISRQLRRFVQNAMRDPANTSKSVCDQSRQRGFEAHNPPCRYASIIKVLQLIKPVVLMATAVF